MLSTFAFNFHLRRYNEVQVHWSAGALPTDIDKRDGWRLAVDVVPVAGPGESAPDVVGRAARYNFPRLALASCLSLKSLELSHL